LLKGGRISPEKLLNTYKYSEQRRFETLKEMYLDIQAAKALGMSNNRIKARVKRRGVSSDVFNELIKGTYTPKRPTVFFKKRMSQITKDLNKDSDEQIEELWKKQLPLKEFSATTNFKSYDDLKSKFEKVVYGTGKTTTADEIDIPPVSAADVEVSEPKVSEPPQSETSPSDDEDDTMNYFSKLVND